MDENYPKIGDDVEAVAYQLILEDHIKFVDPKKYRLQDKGIDPAQYFITSGDAVEKARVLERDMWVLAGELRKKCYALIAEEHNCSYTAAQELHRSGIRPQHHQEFTDYEQEVWKAAGCSRKLLNALIKAKGHNIFLETEWNNHMLLCIPKNPRR